MKFRYEIEYPRKVVAIGISKYGEEYRGVAVCAEGDIFDVNKGKAIARMKAEIKQLVRIKANAEKTADHYFEKGNRAAKRRLNAHKAIEKINRKLGEIGE